ncbi:MAG TPA: hypothetical protein VEY91_05495 [Candidatus Limnocylindria bacterium]|nr:hypothetical protein [Candidatus Limnocylindria bacterium]
METWDETKSQAASNEFLLHAYDGWLHSMHQSEEIGERRVQFFISFVTAVAAGLVTLQTATDVWRPALDVMMLAKLSIAALLLIGILTFMRVLHRDHITNGCMAEMKAIQRHFLAGGRGTPLAAKIEREPRKLLRGGLASMMLLLNVLLVAALFALLSTSLDLWATSLCSGAAAVAAGLWLDAYRKQRAKQPWKECSECQAPPSPAAK